MDMKAIKELASRAYNSFFVNEETDELGESIAKAKMEWEYAKDFFQDAEEPDVIDYAIHQLDAAELKYMYLLEQARCKQATAKKSEVS